MSIAWTLVLTFWGMLVGFDFHPILWWLVLVFFCQDLYDMKHKKK